MTRDHYIYDTPQLLARMRSGWHLVKDTRTDEIWCGHCDIHPGAFFELESKGLIHCYRVNHKQYCYQAI